MRFAPLLVRFMPSLKKAYTNSTDPGAANRSQVVTKTLKMTLDHSSGTMDGEVLKGSLVLMLLVKYNLTYYLVGPEVWPEMSYNSTDSYWNIVQPHGSEPSPFGNDVDPRQVQLARARVVRIGPQAAKCARLSASPEVVSRYCKTR